MHRDLKPQNCFLDMKQGVLKIGDFGLSSQLEELQSSTNWQPPPQPKEDPSKIPLPTPQLVDRAAGVFSKNWGTPMYMPPEGNVPDGSTDIFAIGLIMLQLLCPRFTTSMERQRVLEDFKRPEVLVISALDEVHRKWEERREREDQQGGVLPLSGTSPAGGTRESGAGGSESRKQSLGRNGPTPDRGIEDDDGAVVRRSWSGVTLRQLPWHEARSTPADVVSLRTYRDFYLYHRHLIQRCGGHNPADRIPTAELHRALKLYRDWPRAEDKL